MTVKLSYGRLKPVLFAYLALPILVFFAGFLKFFIALPAAAAVCYGYYAAVKRRKEPCDTEKYIEITAARIAALCLIALLWSYLGGLNGFFYQSSDWPWRNAIYRDLVFNRWPVVYSQRNSALVYYIGFWLVPSLPAKLMFAVSGSARFAWFAARMALWLWTAAGLLLVFLCLNIFLGAKRKLHQYLVPLIFIFFSGLDIVGCIVRGNLSFRLNTEIHLEWWADIIQYSSNTTQLFWVFNQSVLTWLAVLCFINEKTPRNYLFIGICCLCCGPLPFIGLVILMLATWAAGLVKGLMEKNAALLLKQTFCAENVLILLLSFPPLAAYYLCNLTLGNSVENGSGFFMEMNMHNLAVYAVFAVLETGIYILLVLPYNRKNPLFYAAAVSLAVIPFFRLGNTMDFCMRASIPALVVLCVMCTDTLLFRKKDTRPKKVAAAMLAAAMMLGAATPAVEIYRGVYNCIKYKTVRLAKQDFDSIGDLDEAGNFTAEDYNLKIFFKYFSR